jgi:hypothetical protein
MDALVAGGLFFVGARGYTTVMGVDASAQTQLIVSGVMAGSAYVSSLTGQNDPAVRALTAGTIFAGSMYALGNENLVLHAALGTVATYGATLLLTMDEKKEDEEDTNGISRPEPSVDRWDRAWPNVSGV